MQMTFALIGKTGGFRLVAFCVLILGISALGGEVRAGGLQKPEGPVLLSVRGGISNTNLDGAADFDLAMLEAIGTKEIITRTPWTDGNSLFEGVPLAALLGATGAQGEKMVAVALNDYRVTASIDVLLAAEAIIAFRRDSELMPLREYGPLWIIVPDEKNEKVKGVGRLNSYMVWQLRSIVIE